MKARTILLLIVSLWTVALAAQPVLKNGSFEPSPDGSWAWTYGAPSLTSVASDATSPHFLRMRLRNGSVVQASQKPDGTTSANSIWVLSGRVRYGASTTVAATVRLTLQFTDPLTGAIAATSSQTLDLQLAGTSWLYFAVQGVSNASCKVNVILRTEPKDGAVNPATFEVPVDFDDIRLEQQIPSSAPTVLTRPSTLASDGSFIVNGAPFFPIGAISTRELASGTTRDALYASLKAAGFNTVQTGHAPGSPDRRNVNVLLSELKTATHYGLKVNAATFMSEIQHGAPYASVKTLLESPWVSSVLCWQMADEPDSNNEHPETSFEGLGLAHREIARLDGNVRPTMLILSGNPYAKAWEQTPPPAGTMRTDRWTGFPSLTQALLSDVYPVPHLPLSRPAEAAAALQAIKAAPWQHTGVVISLGFGFHDGAAAPTFEQARAQVYLALMAGAKSIWWYAIRRDGSTWSAPEMSPLWPRMNKINSEITGLSLPLLRGSRLASSVAEAAPLQVHDRFHVEHVAMTHNSRLYLMANNATRQFTDETYRSLGTAENPAARVRAEFRVPARITSLALGSSNVTWRYDDFDPNVTYVNVLLEPLESRTMVFHYTAGSSDGGVLTP